MESFPLKLRAFDKPVSFSYAPESGSFIILGSVCNQNVCFIAGLLPLHTTNQKHFDSIHPRCRRLLSQIL